MMGKIQFARNVIKNVAAAQAQLADAHHVLPTPTGHTTHRPISAPVKTDNTIKDLVSVQNAIILVQLVTAHQLSASAAH